MQLALTQRFHPMSPKQTSSSECILAACSFHLRLPLNLYLAALGGAIPKASGKSL